MDLQNITESNKMESPRKCLDGQSLSFPSEVQLQNMIQVQDRGANYHGESELQNRRKSPRLSGKNRETEMQNIIESSGKGINRKMVSQSECLERQTLSLPIEVQLPNMAHVQNRSANYKAKPNMRNRRMSPRLLRNKKDINLLNIIESSAKGLERKMESQSECLDRQNLSFPTEVQLPNMAHAQNRNANYNGETNMQYVRKSPRLSGNSGERNLQSISEFSEGMKYQTQSHIEGPGAHMNNLSFPTGVESANMPKVQKKNADYDGKEELQTIRKSPIFLVRNSAVDSQNMFGCADNGESYRMEFQRKGHSRSNVLFPIEVDLVNDSQSQKSKATYDREMDLHNMQKSPRLSGRNSGADMENIIECNEQGDIRCGYEPQKKGSERNKLSFLTEVESTNMPQVQNRSTDDRQMDLQNVRKSPRFMLKNREIDLQNIFERSEKGTKCKRASLRKGSDRNTLPFPIEGHLVNNSLLQATYAKYDTEMDLQNVQKSHCLSGRNKEKHLEDMTECNEEAIKCRTESQKKGSEAKTFSLPTEVESANMPHVPNRNADCDGQMDLQNIRQLPRFIVSNRAFDLQNIIEHSEKGTTCCRESQSIGCDRNMSSPIQVDVVNDSLLQNRRANYDFQNIQKSIWLSGRNGDMDSENTIVFNEQGVKCRPEFQKKGSEGNKLSSPTEVELDDKPQVQSRITDYDGEMALLRIRKSPRLSVRTREMHLQNIPDSSDTGINCMLQAQQKTSEKNNLPSQLEVELTNIPQDRGRSSNCENADGITQKSSKSGPSFEYYISSAKGINLIVDLNSGPSDWTKRFENDMWSNIQYLQTKQFQSFRQEIECLGIKKTKKSIVSGTVSVDKIGISRVGNEPSSTSDGSENYQLQLDLRYVDNGSLDITESKTCSAAGTGDGSLDNLCAINFDTCGVEKSTSAEELERRILVIEKEASDISTEGSESSLSDGSRKRKRRPREIPGAILRSGSRLGARRSMRLSYK